MADEVRLAALDHLVVAVRDTSYASIVLQVRHQWVVEGHDTGFLRDGLVLNFGSNNDCHNLTTTRVTINADECDMAVAVADSRCL